jgi:hypothetical protein
MLAAHTLSIVFNSQAAGGCGLSVKIGIARKGVHQSNYILYKEIMKGNSDFACKSTAKEPDMNQAKGAKPHYNSLYAYPTGTGSTISRQATGGASIQAFSKRLNICPGQRRRLRRKENSPGYA